MFIPTLTAPAVEENEPCSTEVDSEFLPTAEEMILLPTETALTVEETHCAYTLDAPVIANFITIPSKQRILYSVKFCILYS
jgi:hypothetical protein